MSQDKDNHKTTLVINRIGWNDWLITNDLFNYVTGTNQLNRCIEIGQVARQLQQRDHYDAKGVARKQLELEQTLNALMELGREREQHINVMLRVFEFERECEANVNWLKDQQVVASSQDFGTDLEHAESLLSKFSEFVSDLEKNGDRVQKIDEMAQQLCENGYVILFLFICCLTVYLILNCK